MTEEPFLEPDDPDDDDDEEEADLDPVGICRCCGFAGCDGGCMYSFGLNTP
jgi:hypothetical protein